MRSLGPHLVEGVTGIAVIQRHIFLPSRLATGWRSLAAAPPVSPRRAARRHIGNYYRSLVIHLSSFNYRYWLTVRGCRKKCERFGCDWPIDLCKNERSNATLQ